MYGGVGGTPCPANFIASSILAEKLGFNENCYTPESY